MIFIYGNNHFYYGFKMRIRERGQRERERAERERKSEWELKREIKRNENGKKGNGTDGNERIFPDTQTTIYICMRFENIISKYIISTGNCAPKVFLFTALPSGMLNK